MKRAQPDITIAVNGKAHHVEADGETPLLYVLKNELGCGSPHFGCGVGQCGACMVLSGDRAVRSCTLPVARAAAEPITTLEGLSGIGGLHPVQSAFLEEQAAQCGYCTGGMIISLVALLRENPSPSEREIRSALDNNLCRCGSHLRILRAARRAVELSARGAADPAGGGTTP